MHTFKCAGVSVLALAAAGTFPSGRAEALPLARGAGEARVGGGVKHASDTFKCRYHCDDRLRPGYGWQGWSASTAPRPKLATAPALPSADQRPVACPLPPRRPVMVLDDSPHQPIKPEIPRPIGAGPASPVRVIPIGGPGSREGR